MRKSKEDIIRIGDKVRLIEPTFFLYCGYENNIIVVLNELIEKYKEKANRLAMECGVGYDLYEIHDQYYTLASKILRPIAYEIVRKRMNRAERKLFTKTLDWEELKRAYLNPYEFEVLNIKYVKTGFYEPGYLRCGWDGYSDYPPYLSKGRTHKLLELNMGGQFYTNHPFEELEHICLDTVEDIHVEKIKSGEKKLCMTP